MTYRRFRALVGAIVLLVVVGGSVGASDGLSATLGGKLVDPRQAQNLSCHDLDYPVLRCFATAAQMEVDVASRLSVQVAGARALAVAATGYVTVYEHAVYGGSAMAMSTDQAWLSSIGWNDRISSFKSFGATGNFQENSPGGGFVYGYGATTQVSSLSNSYNDKFSSFYIN